MPSNLEHGCWHIPSGLVAPVTAAEVSGCGWMSCDRRPGGPHGELRGSGTDIPAPQAASRGGAGREVEPTQETWCSGGFGPRAPGSTWLCSLPTALGLSPCHQVRHWDTPAFVVRWLCAQSVHTAARGGGSGQSALDLGGGALPHYHSGDRSGGPHARTASGPPPPPKAAQHGCQQGVGRVWGHGYRLPLRVACGCVSHTLGVPDVAPTLGWKLRQASSPHVPPKDLQLHPAELPSANTRARVRAWELPRHGRAPRHPARRCARRDVLTA